MCDLCRRYGAGKHKNCCFNGSRGHNESLLNRPSRAGPLLAVLGTGGTSDVCWRVDGVSHHIILTRPGSVVIAWPSLLTVEKFQPEI